ncbi:MAG TPA: hypothetical protein VGE26_10570 [Sphingobacteriaceae bacterium]
MRLVQKSGKVRPVDLFCSCGSFGFIARMVIGLLCLAPCKVYPQADSANDSTTFADTTGGFGYTFLTVNCFDCFPRNLVYYKKFIIVSGIYKMKDLYSPQSANSATHFRRKIASQNYFKDKEYQLWKSPQVFPGLDVVQEYRSEFIRKMEKENYKVVVFDDLVNTARLSFPDD